MIKNNRGFTMLELLIVIVVVVVLSGTLPKFINSTIKPYIEKEQVIEFVEDIRLEAELHGTKLMSSCQLFEVTTDGQPTEFKVNDGQDNTLNTSSIIDHASYSFKALNGKYFTKDEMRADHNKRTILNKIIIKIFLSGSYKDKASYYASSLHGQLLSSGDGVSFEYPLSSVFMRNSETALSPCLLNPIEPESDSNFL